MAAIDQPKRPNDIVIVRRWGPRYFPDSLVIPIDEQRPGRVFIPIDDRRRSTGWGHTSLWRRRASDR